MGISNGGPPLDDGGNYLMPMSYFIEADWTVPKAGSVSEGAARAELFTMAATRPTEFEFRGNIGSIEVGEVVAGNEYLAQRFGWSLHRVREFVARLVSRGYVEVRMMQFGRAQIRVIAFVEYRQRTIAQLADALFAYIAEQQARRDAMREGVVNGDLNAVGPANSKTYQHGANAVLNAVSGKPLENPSFERGPERGHGALSVIETKPYPKEPGSIGTQSGTRSTLLDSPSTLAERSPERGQELENYVNSKSSVLDTCKNWTQSRTQREDKNLSTVESLTTDSPRTSLFEDGDIDVHAVFAGRSFRWRCPGEAKETRFSYSSMRNILPIAYKSLSEENFVRIVLLEIDGAIVRGVASKSMIGWLKATLPEAVAKAFKRESAAVGITKSLHVPTEFVAMPTIDQQGATWDD
jgi:hypothetical protein